MLKIASIVCATVMLSSCAFLGIGKPVMRPIEVGQSPWENWVVFDQPENGVRLGDAWNLAGTPDRGCYSFTTDTLDQGSWKGYELKWKDSTDMALRLSVATAFGFGASVRSAQSGSIRFHNLVIRRAVNLGPSGPGQCVASVDGVPSKPAIVALIGADSLDFSLSKDLNGSAEAELKGAKAGKVTFQQSSSRGVIARFDGTRLVGAQFLGLSLSRTVDSAVVDYFPVGSYRRLASWSFDVTAERLGDGRYRVLIQRRIPPVAVDTAVVAEGQPFFFGIPRTGVLRGEFFVGTFYRNAPGDAIKVIAERRTYNEEPLNRREARARVINWNSSRP